MSYVIYTLVFSPATIVVPAMLGYLDKYISGDFLLIHIILIVLNVVFFLYIYEEITFMSSKLILKKVGLFGWNQQEIPPR